MRIYKNGNKPQSNLTASPDKYPQGYFKDKSCKWCGNTFMPQAPSHLYCSQKCADRAHADKYLKRAYALSLEEYEKLLEQHDHKCAICGSTGFTIHPNGPLLVVDHDHKTGKVRGMLCHNCNRALGLFQDNIDALKQAIRYLEGATTIRKE